MEFVFIFILRSSAIKDSNDGIVLTQRALKPNEPFEIKIDKMIAKWAGSIEIGVTTHSPDSLEFPSTMTNIRCEIENRPYCCCGRI